MQHSYANEYDRTHRSSPFSLAGGATTVAYREDEKQSMMPKNKTVEVKSIVIDMEATPLTADTLIPAYYSSSPCLAAGGPSGRLLYAKIRTPCIG